MPSPLLPVTLEQGLAMYEQGERLGAFDAVLAAAARAGGAGVVVSADTGFAEIESIAHVVPDAVGVAALLGS